MRLVRVSRNSEATYGVLIQGYTPFAVTLEDPWRENEREVSCIPAGTYQCVRVQSHKFGDTFEVKDVPGRSHILFHAGNTTEDTMGCILVGRRFNDSITAKPSILDSKLGFTDFLKITSMALEFPLEIVEV
jgi:hypothetical protein